MNIQWNAVTWYSKLVAMALFVALPFLGFWYGVQYEKAAQIGNVAGNIGGSMDPYANVAQWQTDTRDDAGFSVSYPIDFAVNDGHAKAPNADWGLLGNRTAGNTFFTLTVPKIIEPMTNFAEATLMIGASAKGSVTKGDCATGGGVTGATSSGTVVVNGIPFAVLRGTGAGAGNFYDSTQYLTFHNGRCYVLQYTIHSAQIANYPKEYGLKEFDPAPIKALLDRVVGTFKFL